MRTTIDLPDSVYRQGERAAQSRGVTVEELIVRVFEDALTAEPALLPAAGEVHPPLLRSRNPGTLSLDSFDFDDLLA
jgi:hypothetical protein